MTTFFPKKNVFSKHTGRWIAGLVLI